ncbi:MAG: serine hydrolase domain-containing protein [Gaiellaceae bacterium]
MRAPETLARELEKLVRGAQAESRLPSLNAAAFSGGEVLWSEAVGLADVEGEEEATPEHQYRVASITKTFVAASIFQLRDEGKLDLEDPLSSHVPEAAHGGPTLRRMLSHLTGLQREPPGEVWEKLEMPSTEELLERLGEAEQVLASHEEFHYSNLAYALLGEVIARASGMPFERYVEQRLLQPIGLEATGWEPTLPARPYFVEPYSDAVQQEPDVAMGGTNAAGGLWSTTGDLARWAGFLADPGPDILAVESARQMSGVQAMVDQEHWTAAHGLGLQLWRKGERVFAGHTGGFPGFLSIVLWSPKEKAGAVAVTNASAWDKIIEVGLELADKAAAQLGAETEPWRPRESPPDEVVPLLGSWWSEASEYVFSWREGRLQARIAGEPTVLPPAVFDQEGPDLWRTVSGRERGEVLRVVRDEEGEIVKLYWATYPFTRAPEPFGASLRQTPGS